jgi:hypothetical protein
MKKESDIKVTVDIKLGKGTATQRKAWQLFWCRMINGVKVDKCQ